LPLYIIIDLLLHLHALMVDHSTHFSFAWSLSLRLHSL